MARLKQPLNEAEIKALTIGKVKKVYNELANDYNRILEQDILLCPKCNEYKNAKSVLTKNPPEFYRDTRWATGFYPICKDCLKSMAEQRTSHREKNKECKESVQRVLRMMDRPYIDDWYENCVKNVNDRNADNGVFDEHPSAFGSYMRGLNSLPQFADKISWEDSDFGDDVCSLENPEENQKIIKSTVADGRKRFGAGYSNEELMFLENEYKDWIARYECNTKAQEKVFKNLAMIELQKDKAIKKNQPTKDLDKAYQDWLDTGNLKPKQNSMDSLSEAQTLGTLIQKFENERPLPEMDDDFKDIDKIGLYDEVFFRGHMAKALGIKNRFSHIYENFMKQFSASKPEIEDEDDSEVLFDQIFGKEE